MSKWPKTKLQGNKNNSTMRCQFVTCCWSVQRKRNVPSLFVEIQIIWTFFKYTGIVYSAHQSVGIIQERALIILKAKSWKQSECLWIGECCVCREIDPIPCSRRGFYSVLPSEKGSIRLSILNLVPHITGAGEIYVSKASKITFIFKRYGKDYTSVKLT